MKRKNFTTDFRRLLCALILVPACSFTLRAANITINSDPSSGVTLGTTITPSSTTDAVLNIDELIHQLGAGNVTVAATDGGKIIVADDLSWDSNYDLTLGDDATGSVEINASVTATGSGKFLIPDKKLKHVRISANKISTGGNQVYGNGYNPGLGTANSDTVYITGASGLALNASSGSITFDAYVRGSNKNLHSETASGQQTCFRNEVNDFADITVNGDVLLGGVRKWTLGISRTTPIPGKVGNSSNSVPDASTPTVETFTVTGKTSFYRGS
ncbi:MAG: hypothetical protein LBB84_01005, partial [Tannerellaceae bacterium]|nr:hypothetical protein [Tannerellaceae bacterium]